MCVWIARKPKRAKAWAGSGDVATETVWYELAGVQGATEFLGYDKELSEAEIVAIVKMVCWSIKLKQGMKSKLF